MRLSFDKDEDAGLPPAHRCSPSEKTGFTFRKMVTWGLLAVGACMGFVPDSLAPLSCAVISDCYEATISESPEEQGLDLFYTKDTDAHGMPVINIERLANITDRQCWNKRGGMAQRAHMI